MTGDEARRRFADARVGRLATVDERSHPHLVPIVFACEGDLIVTAVDDKPKRSRHLKRISNIQSNPAVSVLVDRYDEDWRLLWWIRVDGRARIVDQGPKLKEAIDLLVEKYAQYAQMEPVGPVISIEARSWSFWEAAGD